MTKRISKIDPARARGVLQELDSVVDEFDVDDPEDIQIRVDGLISAFAASGLLSAKGRLRRVRLHDAIGGLKLELPDRDELVVSAESFEDLINSYGDDPPPEDLKEAQELFNEIARALRETLTRVAEGGP